MDNSSCLYIYDIIVVVVVFIAGSSSPLAPTTSPSSIPASSVPGRSFTSRSSCNSSCYCSWYCSSVSSTAGVLLWCSQFTFLWKWEPQTNNNCVFLFASETKTHETFPPVPAILEYQMKPISSYNLHYDKSNIYLVFSIPLSQKDHNRVGCNPHT